MAKAKKKTWGGKRDNQTGRPKKYGEKTTTIRVPVSLVPEIKKLIQSLIS